MHTFNPSSQEEEAGDLLVQDQAGLQSEFPDSQSYTEKPFGVGGRGTTNQPTNTKPTSNSNK